jgi:hypothetical protein
MAPDLPNDSARARLTDAWRNRAVSLKAVSFGLIGVINTAVDYGFFLLARAVLTRSAGALAALGAISSACGCGRPENLLLITANVMSWLVAVSGS